MAEIYEIPINTYNAPSFTMTVNLDGIYFVFRFDWNERDTCWMLSIYDVDGNVIIGCTKLVVNYELISLHKEKVMPSGFLFLIDMTEKGEPCLFDDLGTRCKLFYITL
jgi:hypothetical protein